MVDRVFFLSSLTSWQSDLLVCTLVYLLKEAMRNIELLFWYWMGKNTRKCSKGNSGFNRKMPWLNWNWFPIMSSISIFCNFLLFSKVTLGLRKNFSLEGVWMLFSVKIVKEMELLSECLRLLIPLCSITEKAMNLCCAVKRSHIFSVTVEYCYIYCFILIILCSLMADLS